MARAFKPVDKPIVKRRKSTVKDILAFASLAECPYKPSEDSIFNVANPINYHVNIGQPNKFTRARAERAIADKAFLRPVSEISSNAGIAPSTFYRWVDKGKALIDRLGDDEDGIEFEELSTYEQDLVIFAWRFEHAGGIVDGMALSTVVQGILDGDTELAWKLLKGRGKLDIAQEGSKHVNISIESRVQALPEQPEVFNFLPRAKTLEMEDEDIVTISVED